MLSPFRIAGQDRPRRYVSPLLLSVLRLAFRYCEERRAYVLRVVGTRLGPVLRANRRRGRSSEFQGPERRGVLSEQEAFYRVW